MNDYRENQTLSEDDCLRCVPTDRFGSFLTSRGHNAIGRLALTLGSLLALACAVGVGSWAFLNAKSDPWMLLVGPTLGGMFFYLAVTTVIGGFRSWDFYELGLVRQGPRHRLEISYRDVRWMEYRAFRIYSRGAYAGTYLTLKLGVADGSKLVLNAKHKERGSGFLWRRIEGRDEIEDVRDVIAACVASDLRLMLEAGKLVDWAGYATLSREGVLATKGRWSGDLARWSDLGEFWQTNNRLWIAAQGGARTFCGIPTAGRNFYPCKMVFEEMIKDHLGGSARRQEIERPS